MRLLPMVVYIVAMVWVATPTHERKAGRMFWLSQRIKFHRRIAEAHGQEVLRLESLYAEEIPA